MVKLGENKNNIYLGCPSLDLIKKSNLKIDNTFIKNFKYIGNKLNFKKKYLVMLYHPVTTRYESEKRNAEILLNVCTKLNKQIIWFWPNVDTCSDLISETIRRYREKNKVLSCLL